MSIDIKPSQAQLSKIIQSGRFFDNMISNLVKSQIDNAFLWLKLFSKN